MALSEGIIGPVATSRPNVPVIYWINPDTFPFWQGAEDARLPQSVWVPQTRIDALRIMNLTDPNGHPVVFMPGEALPAWALAYR